MLLKFWGQTNIITNINKINRFLFVISCLFSPTIVYNDRQHLSCPKAKQNILIAPWWWVAIKVKKILLIHDFRSDTGQIKMMQVQLLTFLCYENRRRTEYHCSSAQMLLPSLQFRMMSAVQDGSAQIWDILTHFSMTIFFFNCKIHFQFYYFFFSLKV